MGLAKEGEYLCSQSHLGLPSRQFSSPVRQNTTLETLLTGCISNVDRTCKQSARGLDLPHAMTLSLVGTIATLSILEATNFEEKFWPATAGIGISNSPCGDPWRDLLLSRHTKPKQTRICFPATLSWVMQARAQGIHDGHSPEETGPTKKPSPCSTAMSCNAPVSHGSPRDEPRRFRKYGE